jgi:hypothetical protein
MSGMAPFELASFVVWRLNSVGTVRAAAEPPALDPPAFE